MVAISAPSSLASFTASRASSSKNPHVTLSTVEGSGGKLGVASVQGDGVWTYDLVSLRPVSTYTVPPSTRFAGPAISYIIQPSAPLANGPGKGKGKGKEKQREEDAEEVAEVMEVDGEEDVELSSSVDSEESPAEPNGPVRWTMVPVEVKEQGEVWVWDGEEGDEKVVIHLDHPTHRLHTIPSSPYPVIAIHSASQLSLIGPRHTVHPISAPSASSASAHIITSRVVPSDAVSSGLITVTETGQVTSLRIEHPEDGNPSLRVISESVISLPSVPASAAKAAATGKNDASTPKKSRNRHSTAASAKATIASADIRSDGLIALITSTGAVMTYDILTSSIISTAQPIASPSSAAVLLLPASAPGDSRKAVSLVSTAKSSAAPASLIATLSSVSPAVVGAADIASILPTEQSSVQHLQILKEGSKGRCVVGLVAWHPTQTAGTPGHGQTPQAKEAEGEKVKGGRSIVHLVEVDAPLKSVGMSALLGSAATTAKYLSSETGKSATATTTGGLTASAEMSTPATSPLDALISRPSRSPADWTSVHSILASPTGSTIPSAQLARVLKLSIAEGGERTEEMYKAILELPPPDLAFRLELRRQLNAEEGSALLELLMRWAETVVEGDEGVKWGQEVDSTPIKPTLPQILLHASLLLDSLLPLLLSHPPAHSLLTALSDLLGPMLEQQRTLSQLRAPIDALLTLAKREERRRALVREKRAALRGENGAAGQEGKEGKSGKGSAKLSEAERTRMDRGTGQAGRLGLGGDVGLWSVEEFDF